VCWATKEGGTHQRERAAAALVEVSPSASWDAADANETKNPTKKGFVDKKRRMKQAAQSV
jgi:hypothetical protein